MSLSNCGTEIYVFPLAIVTFAKFTALIQEQSTERCELNQNIKNFCFMHYFTDFK